MAAPVLPTVTPGPTTKRQQYKPGAFSHLPIFFRRVLKWRQMDLEFTFWQMLYLCLNPSIVYAFPTRKLTCTACLASRLVSFLPFFPNLRRYRHTTYHKQTKNQWARDDPAFVVITSLLVAVAAAAYCVAFGDTFLRSAVTIVLAVLVDFLFLGCVLATSGWLLSNRYLRATGMHSHAVEQRVEWMYAFDVHCNSYFPLFLILYVGQYFLCPLLLRESFFSTVLSNSLYGIAMSYYHYTQFLGYSALPFLDRTEFFLYPIAGIAILLPISILVGFNPTRFVLGIYFST